MQMPKQHKGLTKDLSPRAVTMSFLEGFECPTCNKPVTSSSIYVYCYECGVYWDYTAIEETKNA